MVRVTLPGGATVELPATAEEAARLRRLAAKGKRHLAKTVRFPPGDPELHERAVALIRAMSDEADVMAEAIEAELRS